MNYALAVITKIFSISQMICVANYGQFRSPDGKGDDWTESPTPQIMPDNVQPYTTFFPGAIAAALALLLSRGPAPSHMISSEKQQAYVRELYNKTNMSSGIFEGLVYKGSFVC